ncbi:MAG: hypothetical protein MN733_42130 [Nitrososphaera sp.]|nr:hypothetical protein [Nitrososphaera sp.]
MKRFFKRAATEERSGWPDRLIVAGVLAFALYLGGVFLGADPSFPDVLKDIGVALGVAVVIAFLVDRLLHLSLVDIMQSSSDVMRGAAALHVHDVFARSTHYEGWQRWQSKVHKALEEQFSSGRGEILVMCVAAPEFFRRGSPIGDLIASSITDPQSECKLKVIISCPTSDACKDRAELERGHPAIGDVYNAAQYLKLLSKTPKDAVLFKCYEREVPSFMVLTDNWLFLEPYPLGKLTNPSQVPLGGHTPMLMISKDGAAYNRWRAHFEHAWERSTAFSGHHETDPRWKSLETEP